MLEIIFESGLNLNLVPFFSGIAALFCVCLFIKLKWGNCKIYSLF